MGQQRQNLSRRCRYLRAGTEYCSDTLLVHRIVVLWRHHTAQNNNDIRCLLVLELGHHLRDQRSVGRGLRGHPNNVHVIFDCLADRLGRGLKKWPNVYVEAQIGKCGGYNLGTPIVAILP